MGWVLAAVTVAAFLYTMYKMPKIGVSKQEWSSNPTCEEGIPVPVLFGTKVISSPNITWFGKVNRDADRFYASAQFSLCHGQLDYLRAIYVGEKEVWSSMAAGGVDYYDGYIFGTQMDSEDDVIRGPFVLKTGVMNDSGTDDGSPSHPDDYIGPAMGLTDDKWPKSYGIATVDARNVWVGSTPYLRPWSFRAQRIHLADSGAATQWYDAKSEIKIGRDRQDSWKYLVQAVSDSTDCSGVGFSDGAWPVGYGAFSNNFNPFAPGFPGLPQARTDVSDGVHIGNSNGTYWVVKGTKIWLRRDLGPLPLEPLGVRCWHDDGATLWFNGNAITLNPIYSDKDPNSYRFNSRATIPVEYITAGGPNIVAYKVQDSVPTGDGRYIYAGIQIGPDENEPSAIVDMNPIHAIRECLTDTIWGMGYPSSDVDSTSFEDAADTCFDEFMGISVLWDRQTEIQEFIAEVLRHVNGVLYVDRSTGKFTIKLLRSDYLTWLLPVMDESNIASVADVNRPAVGELVNSVTVTYSKAPKGDTGTVTVHDTGLIQSQGATVGSKLDFPLFSNHYTASKAAWRALRGLSSPLLSARLSCNRDAASFNVGDPFVWNWPDLEVDGVVMRCTDISAEEGDSNMVTIGAVEDVFYTPPTVVVPAGIEWPPQVLGPLPGSTSSSLWYTVQILDPLNKGLAAAQFYCPSEGGLFTGWTEIEPGVMRRDVLGPLDSTWFDGIDPDTSNHAGSWLVGQRVIAYKEDSTGNEFAGVYIFKDIGCYWYETSPGVWAMASTQAQMYRDPDYDNGSDFISGMTFMIRTTTGWKWGSLVTDGVVLGQTEQSWTFQDEGEPEWTNQFRWLNETQLADANVNNAVVDQTQTSMGADFPNACEMLSGSPNLSLLPGGRWEFNIEAAWLAADDPLAETRIGFKIYRDRDGEYVGNTLFEATSPPIHATVPTPLSFTYDAQSIFIQTIDKLVLIPFMTTTSSTPVTITMRYSSEGAGTFVKVPFEPGEMVVMAHQYSGGRMLDTVEADGIIVVSDSTGSASVTLTAGETYHGISTPHPADGDLLILTIDGATNESPIVIEHMGTVPDTAKPIFMSSESGLGSTYEDLHIFAGRARIMLSFNETEDSWQLLPGGAIV